ncbi:MAG: hypothetical protein Q4E11_00090 [Corynebacterium sp.]|uniref:hypothetical protein n=1 Tax=Corynebacterium sp. TaxID=1720 RepID=UPI0026DB347F|nr:hypothetical protein [Corynebacterium sp.]MDO5028972.1 hypothetical protein [Corynebacterium sp.]
MQPLNSFEDLVEVFGAERVRRCLPMALDVVLTGQGIGTYLAEVDGESIEYDAMMLPGVTSCTCDDFTVRHFCDHVAAVAVIVLGRGSMPEEAELDSELDSLSPTEIINSLPVQDLREILLSQLEATIPLGIALRLREQTEQSLTVPYGPDDTERFAPVRSAAEVFDRFAGDSDALIVAVENFINVVTPFQQAGYGPRLVQPVMEAASNIQKLIQKIGPSERLYSTWDSVVDLVKACSVPAKEQLVGWVEETLENEKPGQEFLTLDKIFSLLGDDQLRQLVDWLRAQNDDRIETWERTISISEKLGLDDVCRHQMLHVPRAAWNLAADRVLHKSSTTERISYIRNFFEQGLFAFGRSSAETYSAEPVLEWLLDSDSQEAQTLYEEMALALFDPRYPWESLRAVASVNSITAAEEATYLSQAKDVLDSEQLLLFQLILKSFGPEPERGAALISRSDAAKLDNMQSWIAFNRLQHSMPLTAINLGLGSIESEYRLFPSYHQQTIAEHLVDVKELAETVEETEAFDEFLGEFISQTCNDARMKSALRDAGLMPRDGENGE